MDVRNHGACRCRLCYFLAPSGNSAPDTTIKLGQVFSDISRPDLGLREPEYISTEIYKDTKYNWKWAQQAGKTRQWTLSATILAQFLGVGPDVGLTRSSARILEYAAGSLEIKYFIPLEYLQASLKTIAVSNYLDENRRVSLYMVTGIKVARNPSMRRVLEREHAGAIGLSCDLTPTGAPASGTFSIGRGSNASDTQVYDS